MASETSSAATAHSTVERAAQAAHETIDRMASKAGPALDNLQSAAADAAESMQARAQALGEMEEQWIETAREYVRAHPLTAVAVGLLAGVVIARLTR